MSESELAVPLEGSPTSHDQDLGHQTEHMRREHLLLDPRQLSDMGAEVMRPVLQTGRRFWLLVVVLGGLFVTAAVTWIIQMTYGIGITGLNRPVEWAPYITNFVYFVGIGHAGTFISAAFRVLKIEMRRPISRIAEAVTIFALATAALFPIIHLGRSWRFYYLMPYPNQRELWPSFHSPLAWDLMAILTYLTGSIIFMYIGLLPDLAMARDHTTGWRHRLYKILSLSWRGTAREWARHELVLNIFSYVIIPVMFSVHTIVSWDFAMALQPGWHSSIFGPYFIAGALFSGVGAVTIVMAIVRKAFHLEYFLRKEHFDGMAKLLLVLSFTWAYFFFAEFITQWYGGLPLDKAVQALWGGPAAPLFALMLFSNVLVPAATLWSRRIRRSIPALLTVCIFVQIGMYAERALIVGVTLGINELPFNWGVYFVRLPEILMTFGAFALVALLYALFSKIIPLIPAWEVREGQMLRGLRRVGRAIIPTRSEMD